jgi:Transcriptional regulator
MSTLRFMRTFVAVARHGSFTEAAEHVALTQAAVSFQMKALENELGCALFERSGRLAILSPAGREMLPKIEQMLQQYDALRARRPPPGELAGSAGFGAIVSCMGALSRVVSGLKRAHPALVVRVRSGKSTELADRVEAGELDAALVVALGRSRPALRWTPLYEEPLVVVAPAGATVRRPRDALARLPFLRFDRSERTGMLVERTLRRLQWPVNDFLELNSIETLVELVRQEVGATLLPLLRGAAWERDPALRVLPLPARLEGAVRPIGMIESAERAGDRIVATICQECAQTFRQPPRSGH